MMNVRLSRSNTTKEFEYFLDNNRDDLSPNMFGELVSLFEYIDDEAVKVEEELDSSNSELENSKEEIEDLEQRLYDSENKD